MLGKVHFLAAALCVSSCAMAANHSIGTVTSRGETKIDSYEVKSSGTIFDGSLVETGGSEGADIRLGNNAVVTLYSNTRGSIHHDYFRLERGSVRLASTSSFNVQAESLIVVPAEAGSVGLVSIEDGNSVQVVTQSGTFEVRNAAGAAVAEVHPGHPLAFSPTSGKPSSEFTAAGKISSQNGHYYLTTSQTEMKYELKGDNLGSYDGASVIAFGTLQAAAPSGSAAGLILAKSVEAPGAFTLPGVSNQPLAQVDGVSIGPAIAGASCFKFPGLFGGHCCISQFVTCCPKGEPDIRLCCPGYVSNGTKQCGPSH